MSDIKSWNEFIHQESEKPYYKQLEKKIAFERKKNIIFPPKSETFNAFALTPLNKVKVVILGQDPYHEPNQAHGLAFSVKSGQIPPSLQNIYKELQNEFDFPIPKRNGNLTPWTKQGVLLLNSTLTVQKGAANSHANFGWQTFTDNAISLLNQQKSPIVFILWGKNARSKKDLITNPSHLVLESVHPSPFSASHGFFGNNHFKLCNEFLKKNNMEEINWQIKD